MFRWLKRKADVPAAKAPPEPPPERPNPYEGLSAAAIEAVARGAAAERLEWTTDAAVDARVARINGPPEPPAWMKTEVRVEPPKTPEEEAAEKAFLAERYQELTRPQRTEEELRKMEAAREQARRMVEEAAVRRAAADAELAIRYRPIGAAHGEMEDWIELPIGSVSIGGEGYEVFPWVLTRGICTAMADAHRWPLEKQIRGTEYLRAAQDYLRDTYGRVASDETARTTLAALGYMLDIPGKGSAPAIPDLCFVNLDEHRVCYAVPETGYPLVPKMFDPYRAYLEQLLDGPVMIQTAREAGVTQRGAVVVRREPLILLPPGVSAVPPSGTSAGVPSLPPKIALRPSPEGQIVLGTNLFTGEVVTRPVSAIPHMLVVGTPGFGKSVFLHQLVSQLTGHAEVARVYLVDLKGGVEFMSYADKGATQVVSSYEGVIGVVAELLALLELRQREMVARRERTWRQGRVFLVIDEFAQVQLWPAQSREAKEQKARLIGDLTKLSMLGRAVGIVLIAAIQKATTDVMDSSFRTNLQGQVCFRVANRLMAASMFGDTESLRLDPIALRRGQFIFLDPALGETLYLQAHVAPLALD